MINVTEKQVLLVDDHSVVRNGVKAAISNVDNLRVVAEATDGEEGWDKLKELKPDIIILDISLPKLSGIELLYRIKLEEFPVKVLIFTMHKDEEYIMACMDGGASGYLLKDSSDQELLTALYTIANGQTYYSGLVTQVMVKKLSDKNIIGPVSKDSLTRREKEILGYLVRGSSNKEISAKIFISVRTVDSHRTNIMRKLKVKNVAELVWVTLNNKIIPV